MELLFAVVIMNFGYVTANKATGYEFIDQLLKYFGGGDGDNNGGERFHCLGQ